EVPAVEIVNVPVTIIVHTRLAFQFSLVGPELVTKVFVVDIGAIIEYRDDDRLGGLAVAPGERAGDIINPPEIAGAITAVVRRRIVHWRGRQKCRTRHGATWEFRLLLGVSPRQTQAGQQAAQAGGARGGRCHPPSVSTRGPRFRN